MARGIVATINIEIYCNSVATLNIAILQVEYIIQIERKRGKYPSTYICKQNKKVKLKGTSIKTRKVIKNSGV